MNAQVRINLHCHSTLSDGDLTPEELVGRLAASGVRAAALTDHDTLEGLPAFHEAAASREIGCITGVELSVVGPDGAELHLLGYGFDPADAALCAAVVRAQDRKRVATRQAFRSAIESAWPPASAEETSSTTPPISSAGAISAADAIALLHQAGGLAVLAHPLTQDREYTLETVEPLIVHLKEAGLDGIEAIYGGYPPQTRDALLALAARHGLLVSAGSDFHSTTQPGFSDPSIEMPEELWKPFRDAVFDREHATSAPSPPSVPSEKRRPQAPHWKRFTLRILVPTFLAITLFVVSIYQIIIPSFEQKLLERKRDMIRELTRLACGILVEYDGEVREGRLDLAQAQKAAAERIQALRYGQEEKDYFWLTDMHPRMVAHPYRPDLNGKDLSDFKDQRGARIFVEFVNVLKNADDGYVEYVWQWKDNPERLAPKQSYIKKFAPWGWIVGTGLYVEDVRREIVAMEARIVHVSLAITVFSALLLVFVALQTMRIERQRQRAEDELHQSHEKYRTLVEAAADGILMVIEGKYTYANKTLLDMLNYSQAELPLLDLKDIFPETAGERSGSALVDWLEKENPLPPTCETLLRRKGGATIEVALTAAPISFSGRSGFILAARDLAGKSRREMGRKRREAEMESQIAELQTSLMFFHTPITTCTTKAIRCDMRDPVSKVAEWMTREDSSAILVTSEGETVGIVTDHDIRERVVSKSLPADYPVYPIMSSPLIYVPHQAVVYEAILVMRERNVRHLVARDETGQITGIVDNRDLLRFHRYSPALLTQEARQAESVEKLIAVRRDLPKLVKALIETGARTRSITRAITTISDALASRLIHFAVAQLGPPPARFAFLALGSEGREEQNLASDQDNAIVFEDVDDPARPAVQEYFLQLGTLVCDWLDRAGYASCEGKIMASNSRWCQPLRVWKEYFTQWIRTAEPQSILEIMTFFDLRVVQGEREFAAALRRHIDELLAQEPPFLLHCAQYALQYKIPLGFFGNIVVDSAKDRLPTFNIKEAMMPVVNFARLYALRHQVAETHTLERLRELMESDALRKPLHDEVVSVYDYLMQMRLSHQVRMTDQGKCPDNAIAPKNLTHMEESLLKQAFAQIVNIQKKISYDFLGAA